MHFSLITWVKYLFLPEKMCTLCIYKMQGKPKNIKIFDVKYYWIVCHLLVYVIISYTYIVEIILQIKDIFSFLPQCQRNTSKKKTQISEMRTTIVVFFFWIRKILATNEKPFKTLTICRFPVAFFRTHNIFFTRAIIIKCIYI